MLRRPISLLLVHRRTYSVLGGAEMLFPQHRFDQDYLGSNLDIWINSCLPPRATQIPVREFFRGARLTSRAFVHNPVNLLCQPLKLLAEAKEEADQEMRALSCKAVESLLLKSASWLNRQDIALVATTHNFQPKHRPAARTYLVPHELPSSALCLDMQDHGCCGSLTALSAISKCLEAMPTKAALIINTCVGTTQWAGAMQYFIDLAKRNNAPLDKSAIIFASLISDAASCALILGPKFKRSLSSDIEVRFVDHACEHEMLASPQKFVSVDEWGYGNVIHGARPDSMKQCSVPAGQRAFTGMLARNHISMVNIHHHLPNPMVDEGLQHYLELAGITQTDVRLSRKLYADEGLQPAGTVLRLFKNILLAAKQGAYQHSQYGLVTAWGYGVQCATSLIKFARPDACMKDCYAVHGGSLC